MAVRIDLPHIPGPCRPTVWAVRRKSTTPPSGWAWTRNSPGSSWSPGPCSRTEKAKHPEGSLLLGIVVSLGRLQNPSMTSSSSAIPRRDW